MTANHNRHRVAWKPWGGGGALLLLIQIPSLITALLQRGAPAPPSSVGWLHWAEGALEKDATEICPDPLHGLPGET